MRVDKLPPVKATLQPSNHPYLNGAWTPQHAGSPRLTLM